MNQLNPKSLLITIITTFVVLTATDYCIHQLWLMPVYNATASLWRPDMAAGGHLIWIHAGHLLAAITFAMLWAVGFAANAKITCGMKYGSFMALFSQSHTLIGYAVHPYTLELVWKWMVSGVLQGVLLGIVVFLVYKPATK